MKILLVSDVESPYLYDYYVPGRLDGIDLIISCGDLSARYLSFLSSASNKRLLYVPGNHDGSYLSSPPEGCENIDDKLVEVKGLRILGLGGSPAYNGGPYQYSEAQMRRRVWRQGLRVRRAGGVDLVVTHAAPRGLGDTDDHVHRGFEAFLPLIDDYEPRWFVHGHVHLNYGPNIPRVLRHGSTDVINAYERYVLEV